MSVRWNFGAGPAALPRSVLERARQELLETDGTGLPALCWSHRSDAYLRVHEEVTARLRHLADLSEDGEHEVLILQGGASIHFAQVPLNFASAERRGAYVLTGSWARKALAEAVRLGRGSGLGSPQAAAGGPMPDPAELAADLPPSSSYVHVTSNNTIFGTRWAQLPLGLRAPLIVDASSDLFSRPLPVRECGMVYAGAQKNLGPAGLGVVFVRRDLLARVPEGVPAILSYRAHAAASGPYHTPPTFGVWLMREVLRWTEHEGGVAALAERNEGKARRLYAHLEGSAFWRLPVRPADRSLMNVVFEPAHAPLTDVFVREAEAEGLVGLRGHRERGGLRASLYNAIPLRAVEDLVAFLGEFERRHG